MRGGCRWHYASPRIRFSTLIESTTGRGSELSSGEGKKNVYEDERREMHKNDAELSRILYFLQPSALILLRSTFFDFAKVPSGTKVPTYLLNKPLD